MRRETSQRCCHLKRPMWLHSQRIGSFMTHEPKKHIIYTKKITTTESMTWLTYVIITVSWCKSWLDVVICCDSQSRCSHGISVRSDYNIVAKSSTAEVYTRISIILSRQRCTQPYFSLYWAHYMELLMSFSCNPNYSYCHSKHEMKWLSPRWYNDQFIYIQLIKESKQNYANESASNAQSIYTNKSHETFGFCCCCCCVDVKNNANSRTIFMICNTQKTPRINRMVIIHLVDLWLMCVRFVCVPDLFIFIHFDRSRLEHIVLLLVECFPLVSSEFWKYLGFFLCVT